MTARHTRGILGAAGLFTAASFLHAQTGTPLQIVTNSLPPASVGAAYNQQLITTGGVCSSIGAASSTIDSGALPPGLSVTSPGSIEQWSIQGTPSAAGNFTFTVHLFWIHTRATPFEQQCVDDAVKALALTVQANQSLAADRAQLTTTYHTGHFPPAPDTVQVTAAGGASVTFALQSVTDSGGPWLSATAQQFSTPAALTIGYLVSGLAPGTYTGRVIVTTGGLAALTIQVTLVVVTDASIQLQATPSALVFSAVAGGPDPPSQPLAIAVVGSNVIFQAAVTAAPPNGKWLTVAPSGSATPATLTVAVTAKGLAAAVYSGTLTLSVPGVPNSSLNVPVTFTITAPLPVVKPTIAPGGVVNAAGLGAAIAPGTWVSLYGTSLSATTRAWRDTDFQNGLLPTALDGVSVTIDGKPAAVAFISPYQVNVLAPDDTATGLVPVQVKNALGTSDSVLALQQTAAPAFFQLRAVSATYVAGTHADGSLLAGPALIQQGFTGTAARAGETIVLFGTGFGTTQPAISATALVPAPLPLAHPEELVVRIGGLDTAIAYAGLISPGVYQFNVVVPQLAAGDQSVAAELRGLLTQSNLLLTIQP
ncbi:MAG: hypothetical protein ABSC05_27435 [Candidatus Solibacter sp.]|jgi:uncharacterized protein (TIGR03437 family)